MSSSQDTEITLGTGKLVGLFFGLVMVCAIFFGLGYSLGHKSETAAAAFSPAPVAATTAKPGAAGTHPSPAASAESAFRADHPDQPARAAVASPTPATAGDPQVTPVAASGGTPADAPAAASTGSYSVQVAAVSHQEDADALADALRKKQYSAAVVAGIGSDKLFHVQVGPFADIKDAEAMKTRLTGDGYNPIVKK